MKNDNVKFKNLKKLKAFTIVELLVAMGLFVVLIGISTGGFIKALQTQKAIVGLMEANDNANLALEQMAREIRTGYNFSKISDTELQFVNQRNEVVWYRLNEEAVERGTEKEGVVSQRIYKKITADNVKIADFSIVVLDKTISGYYQPRITISLSVGPTGRYLENILTNFQTTISARTLAL